MGSNGRPRPASFLGATTYRSQGVLTDCGIAVVRSCYQCEQTFFPTPRGGDAGATLWRLRSSPLCCRGSSTASALASWASSWHLHQGSFFFVGVALRSPYVPSLCP